MKTTKFLVSALVSALMSIFLIATVSAALAYGDWADGSQTLNANAGDIVGFNVDFLSASPPMTINAKLYNPSDALVQAFEDNRVISATSFFNSYTFDTTGFSGGNYELILQASDGYSSDSHTIYLNINSIDTVAPVITLLGSNPQTIELGSVYTELGATATDGFDGDVTGSIVTDSSAVNINALGSYNVVYTVTDTAGNIGTAIRTVNVIDTTLPVITITNIVDGETYDEHKTRLNFNVIDADTATVCTYSLDNGATFTTISCSSNILGIESDEGSNTWLVRATDSSGNTATASVTFTIELSDSDDENDNSYSYTDPTETEYLEQFEPTALPEIELEPETTAKGWFARLIEAIVNFFKALFGVD